MFKKKANNNKKIDLQQETEQINTRQQQKTQPTDNINLQAFERRAQNEIDGPISNGSRTPIYRKKMKINLFSLQGMQRSDVGEQKALNSNLFPYEEEKVAISEIQQCFDQIRKLKESQPIIEEQQPQHHRPFQQREKMTIRMEDVNLESQPEILEIQVDEDGGFSPQLGYGRMEDYDDVNGDYEDELIRKTLTKRNYDNLGKYGGISLNKLKQNEAKDSFVQKLKKVNVNSIRKAISRDLHNKKLKLKELKETVQEITSHGVSKKDEIAKKQKTLGALKDQFQRVGKVIEYIYYWGDKIKEFNMKQIQKEIAERQKKNNTFDMDEQEEQF